MRATRLIKIHVQFAGFAGLRNRAVVQVSSRGTARLSFRTISSVEADWPGLSLSIAMPAEFSTGFSYKLEIYVVPPGSSNVPMPRRFQLDTRSSNSSVKQWNDISNLRALAITRHAATGIFGVWSLEEEFLVTFQ